MIQCEQCEYFQRGPGGSAIFKCDPCSTIKEPECLTKLQLVRTVEMGQKIDRLVNAYEQTLAIYRRMQPLQEKMFEHMEREIKETEDGDAWKYNLEDEDKDEENNDFI